MCYCTVQVAAPRLGEPRDVENGRRATPPPGRRRTSATGSSLSARRSSRLGGCRCLVAPHQTGARHFGPLPFTSDLRPLRRDFVRRPPSCSVQPPSTPVVSLRPQPQPSHHQSSPLSLSHPEPALWLRTPNPRSARFSSRQGSRFVIHGCLRCSFLSFAAPSGTFLMSFFLPLVQCSAHRRRADDSAS
jgi:hypothetical protein